MPYPVGQVPLKALAGKKRAAAGRHAEMADTFTREAAELDAEAERRERLAEQVRAERVAQGLHPEMSDAQIDAIGTVWASRPRTTQDRK